MNERFFAMKQTMDEITEARAVVPYYRADHFLSSYLNRSPGFTRDMIFELIQWAYSFDTEYDWTYKITCQSTSWMEQYSSYEKAKKVVSDWFGVNGSFPLNEKNEQGENLFDSMVLLVFDTWLQEVIAYYKANSTWRGVVGRHCVRWSSELGGHVVCFSEINLDENKIDMQL
jgi:hypothetical protein